MKIIGRREKMAGLMFKFIYSKVIPALSILPVYIVCLAPALCLSSHRLGLKIYSSGHQSM